MINICPNCSNIYTTSSSKIVEIHPYDVIIKCSKCDEKIAIGFNTEGLKLKGVEKWKLVTTANKIYYKNYLTIDNSKYYHHHDIIREYEKYRGRK